MPFFVPISRLIHFTEVGSIQPIIQTAALLTSVSAPSISETPQSSGLEAPAIDRAVSVPLSIDNIPSEKLAQFVAAYESVMKLVQRNEALIAIAETEQDSLRLQQAIETSAARLIEQAGLTRSEYIQLLSLANLDDEFGERVATILQEKP